MKQEHINEVKAIVILSLSIILFASLVSFVPEDLSWFTSHPNVPAHNWIRITGAYTAGALFFMFGYGAYFLVAFLLFWSWNKFSSNELQFTFPKFISFCVLFIVSSSLFSLTGPSFNVPQFQRGGLIGLISADFLLRYMGQMGSYIILIALGTLALIINGEFLISPIIHKLVEVVPLWIQALRERFQTEEGVAVAKPSPKVKPRINFGMNATPKGKKAKVADEEEDEDEYEDEEDEDEDEEYEYIEVDEDEEEEEAPQGKPKIKIAPQDKNQSDEHSEIKIVGEYKIPPLDLLEDPPVLSTQKIESDLISGASLLEETLASFGVTAHVADIERGPAITRYELEPAPGVKVQKFTALSDDIALAMKAAAVRVVAPIPGKNRVGIEVPNGSSATVYLKNVLSSDKFSSAKSKLTLSLGKDIAGEPMVADLAEMPHLMIAGTTGAGKTVCVNGIIMSMLLNASPDEVRFILIDPKMVEMAQYNGIPHLLCPTVTDSQKASSALNWVVMEMEQRYKKLAKEKVRNIKAYNAKGLHMPYIVLIIDELADLMQVSAKTVESAITRIAQLSRAVGIHMILATQRPSVDVITGVIKANFPARISFKVASKIDSRTVLDMNGAETLLGKGDMLFIKPGDAKPTRGQGNFVKDDEINKVIQFIKDQQAPEYDDSITKQQRASAGGGSDQQDEYYDEAVRLVIETNQASVSILQRRMRLGYTRAARLIDMMEQQGVVGPYCGSKPRELLVDREQWLLENMQEENADGDEDG